MDAEVVDHFLNFSFSRDAGSNVLRPSGVNGKSFELDDIAEGC
jgi:hypothetical protein